MVGMVFVTVLTWCCTSDNYWLVVHACLHAQIPLRHFIYCAFRRGNAHLPLPLPLTKKTLPRHPRPPLCPTACYLRSETKTEEAESSWFRSPPQEYLFTSRCEFALISTVCPVLKVTADDQVSQAPDQTTNLPSLPKDSSLGRNVNVQKNI